MEGLPGKFFRPLGMAYVSAISVSLLVALTVTPAMCLLLWVAADRWNIVTRRSSDAEGRLLVCAAVVPPIPRGDSCGFLPLDDVAPRLRSRSWAASSCRIFVSRTL